MRIVVALSKRRRILLGETDVSPLVNTFDLAVLQVAIDSMFLDALTNLGLGGFGKFPE